MSRRPSARAALARDRARRRRLRLWLAVAAWVAFVVALGWHLHAALPAAALSAALRSPGAWVPLAMVVLGLSGVWLARARFGALGVALHRGRITVKPSKLRALLSGRGPLEIDLGEVTRAWRVPLRDGAVLFLGCPVPAPPIGLPLTHPEVAHNLAAVLQALPETALAPAERAGMTAIARVPELNRPAPRDPTAAARARLVGLWELAAPAAWRALGDAPEEPDRVHELWAVEGVRLPVAARLRLLDALLDRFPEDPLLLLETARHLASVRRGKLALEALRRLGGRSAHPEATTFWRDVLRTHRSLPAPPSRSTFGIEVNLPHHDLVEARLVVDDRWEIPLEWFVGFRLLPGFWGPPRGIELVTVRGERRLLMGDPMDWVGRLTGVAPWLAELHDHGLYWPPLWARLRHLPAARPRAAPQPE